MKTCTKCGRTLPVTAFDHDRRRTDGRTARCRTCRQQEQQKRRSRTGWRGPTGTLRLPGEHRL